MSDLRFEFNGETYYGVEDFIQRVDLTNFEGVDRTTGERMNPYELFWKLMKEKLDDISAEEEIDD